MKNIVSLALLLTLATPAPADAQRAADEARVPGEPRAWTAVEQREPSLAEAREAALRYAGLDERPERGWARRTRLAGLMPVLTIRANSGTAHDEDLSRASSGVERLAVSHDRDLRFEARAVWQLDRLLFDGAELRAAQLERQRHRERQDLLAKVTSLYYQRRKLQLARSAAKGKGDDAAGALAIEEITAQLDALTGGYFARALHAPRP